MHIETYLSRINYEGPLTADLPELIRLHRSHLFHIPFENLDIHLGNTIRLQLSAIYKKVVELHRGGYCYELNSLFNWLLVQLGYQSRIIAAQIVNNNEPNPEFDHMAVTVKLESDWLVDVGFGDLFLSPIEIKPDVVQTDGVNYFMIKALSDDYFSLWMSANGNSFEEKYCFRLNPVAIEDFEEQNQWKQTSPDSHFVKNLICTQPTRMGRSTIFNQKFLQRNGNQRKITTFDNNDELAQCLRNEFGIDISAHQHKLAESATYSF